MAGLVAAALAVRAIHLDWGLPEVFEEATPVHQAVGFWGTPGQGIDLNPHFFKYPGFTFYLNFILQAIWYFWLSLTGSVGSLNEFRQVLEVDFGKAVLLGRWLQAVLGALVVIPTVILGRRLGGQTAGLCAGALVAVMPTAVIESQLVGPDIALTLFATAALASATALAETGKRSDYLWCGLWIGLAAASKYPGALLLVALVTAHGVQVYRRKEGPAGFLVSSLPWQALVTAAVVFVAASPYVLFDLSTALEDIGFERRHMAWGHLGREEGRAWTYYLAQAIPQGWTWGIAVLSLAGLAGLLVGNNTRARTFPGFVFALTVLLVLGSWRMAAARYILPLAPLGGAWVGSLVGALPGRLALRGRPAMAVALVVTLLALAWPFMSSTREIAFKGREDSRTAAGTWIKNQIPEGSTILVERYGPEPDPETYTVLYLPFHGITPHLYDAAYLPGLYKTFDYVVFSSGVSARYLAQPREYPTQIAFYRTMDTRLDEVAAFAPGIHVGPEIRVLKRTEDSWPAYLGDPPSAFFTANKGNTPLAEYFSALGTVLVRQGNEDLGFFVLTEAVEMDPESPKVWGNLGAMRLHVGLQEEALTAFRRALELDGEDPDLLFNLATLYSRMDEPRQAAAAYRGVLTFRPEMEDAYLGLARALIEDDRYAEARVVLREFLIRFPRSSKRESAEEALRQLLGMGPGRP
jgi:hypothetical protein